MKLEKSTALNIEISSEIWFYRIKKTTTAMKKNLLAFALVLFTTCCMTAQVDNAPWSPAGAVWIYGGNAMMSKPYYKLTYQKDTVFANRMVKKMVLSRFDSVANGPTWYRTVEGVRDNIFMYASNDSIYWYNNNGFQLLYVFSATTGTDWTVRKYTSLSCPRDTTNESSFVTQSVQTASLGGRQFVTINANPSTRTFIGSLIIKNIGSRYTPLPITSGNCIDFTAPNTLLCYRDNTRGTIDFGNGGDCNGLITASQELASRDEMNTLHIVPNPANDKIIIQNRSNLRFAEVKIVDMMGKLHYIARQYTDGEAIDVAFLANGVYVVQMVTTENVVYATRLVKTK